MNHKARLTAEILPTHTAAMFEAAVKRAAELVGSGILVALPTETVYGLAANALDAQAVKAIFDAKRRPRHNPVIVHVAGWEMARRCVADWPAEAEQLARAFWPGPLTLVLPRSAEIPDIVTAGGPTVGVRWPSHPFIQAVIRECGFPLAAPSANPANRLSPTSAEHVRQGLGDRIQLIVDGGQSQVGIESTVVDLTVHPLEVLRPGMIHLESLEAAVPQARVVAAGEPGATLRSPGRMPRHYSPKAPLKILAWRGEPELTAALKGDPRRIHVVTHTVIPSGRNWARVSVIPHDPEAFARAIYSELHRCDELGAELIVVEAVPESNEWRAIADRLRRAAA
jgi:L-threonylcarbamoyladenylate synthase